MDKLLNMGFELAAQTSIINGNLKIEIIQNALASNLLYAYVKKIGDNPSDWHVFYIGHTRKSLKNRLSGYQAGNGVATNNRIHNAIKEILNGNEECLVYALFNRYQMQIHGIDIDIAAAVEYSLIEYYSTFNSENGLPPLLNKAGNLNFREDNQIEYFEQLKEEIFDYVDVKKSNVYFTPQQFEYKLNQTYWKTPNVNIPTQYENLFGLDGETVIIDFYKNTDLINQIEVQINRNANLNQTPRLYVRNLNNSNWFVKWKQSNFKEGDILIVDIIDFNHIKFTAN